MIKTDSDKVNDLTRPLTPKEAKETMARFEAGMKRILQAKPMAQRPKKKK